MKMISCSFFRSVLAAGLLSLAGAVFAGEAVDFEKEFKTFKNLIEDYEIRSYKYGFDTQKTLTLYFDLNRKKGKFVTLEIYLYSNSVVYEWE